MFPKQIGKGKSVNLRNLKWGLFLAAMALQGAMAASADEKAGSKVEEKPAKAQTSKELGKLMHEAIKANDKKKLLALVVPIESIEKLGEGMKFPDEQTKQEMLRESQEHITKKVLPVFEKMLDRANEFAAKSGFEWQNTELVNVKVRERKYDEMLGFGNMDIELRLKDRNDISITLMMDDGAKMADGWYFSDVPRNIMWKKGEETSFASFSDLLKDPKDAKAPE